MAVLSDNQMRSMHCTIERMYRAHVSQENSSVDVDDAINILIKPEHHEIVKIGGKLFTNRFMGTQHVSLNWDAWQQGKRQPIGLLMSIIPDNDVLPFLPPTYAGKEWWVTNKEAHARFSNTANKIVEIYNQYNLMSRVLEILNTKCSSPAQMRFIWPVIKILVDTASEYDKLDTLKKSLDRKPGSSLPLISTQLRDACQSTSTTAVVYEMMGRPAEKPALRTGLSIRTATSTQAVNAWTFT